MSFAAGHVRKNVSLTVLLAHEGQVIRQHVDLPLYLAAIDGEAIKGADLVHVTLTANGRTTTFRLTDLAALKDGAEITVGPVDGLVSTRRTLKQRLLGRRP